jgi:hypothetical protein
MTSRVFDCPPLLSRLEGRSRQRSRPWRQLLLALGGAFVLVPLAGAADPPGGWLSGTLAAVCVLALFVVLGGRASAGWLLLLTGAAGLLAPRAIPSIGPALFVAAGLLCILWLANRGAPRRGGRRMSAGARDAQQNMGRTGEERVRTTLAAGLPEEYVLINGLTLPRAAGDIDHLVVGPSGVFLLETKMMAGYVVCDADGTWRRTKIGRAGTPYVAFIGDPATQAQRNIHAVRDCLRRRAPHLFRGPALWIEGLLVFPHPDTDLSADHSRVPAVHLEDTVHYICAHQPRRVLNTQEVIDVTAALLEERHAGLRLASSAQAVVELALALPIVLALLFGTLALSRVVQAHSAIVVLAHEVARAGALGSTSADARERLRLRAPEGAPGLGRAAEALEVRANVSGFARVDGRRVLATVLYRVNLSDLPLVGWAPAFSLRAEHLEWVDPFRAGIRPPDDDVDR